MTGGSQNGATNVAKPSKNEVRSLSCNSPCKIEHKIKKICIPRTSKTELSHWRGCIFEGLQQLRKSLGNVSKMYPKMTPKSMKRWFGASPEGVSKKAIKKLTTFNKKDPKKDPRGTPKLS